MESEMREEGEGEGEEKRRVDQVREKKEVEERM